MNGKLICRASELPINQSDPDNKWLVGYRILVKEIDFFSWAKTRVFLKAEEKLPPLINISKWLDSLLFLDEDCIPMFRKNEERV